MAKLSAEELERTVGNVETCGGISKLAITREEWGAIRAHIAALKAESADSELREALEDTLEALIQAQDHIRNELQPEFEKLAETGRLSWLWPSEEYDEYKAAWRLSTWWHGCGTDETIELARQALTQTREDKPA